MTRHLLNERAAPAPTTPRGRPGETRRRIPTLAIALGFVVFGLGSAARAQDAGVSSVLAPELPRGMTRVRGTVRPFFSMLGNGGGALADLAIDHYFARVPLRLSLELAPLAIAAASNGKGGIADLRLGAAYVTDYVEIGGAAGTHLSGHNGAGISMAGFLRLGALDGLKLTLTYGYVLARNQYSGKPTLGMKNLISTFDVPIGHRFTLFADGGISADNWIYATLGMRHRLFGDGGKGSWYISGSFGVAWILDRPSCLYPDTGWCTNAAWAAGPTLGLGLEHRF